MLRTMAGIGGIRKSLTQSSTAADLQFAMDTLGARVGLTPMLLPFTTSIILMTVAPASRPASPRNVFFGHVLSALVGLFVVSLSREPLWPATFAVGIAVAAMQITRTLHPPAGITAFIMVATHQGWQFVLLPVAAGAFILVAYSFLFRQMTGGWTRGRSVWRG